MSWGPRNSPFGGCLMKHSTASYQKLITNSFRNQATEVRKNNLQRPLRSNLTLVTFQMCSSNGNNTYLFADEISGFCCSKSWGNSRTYRCEGKLFEDYLATYHLSHHEWVIFRWSITSSNHLKTVYTVAIIHLHSLKIEYSIHICLMFLNF